MARLEVIDGPKEFVVREFALDKEAMVVGRDPQADIVLPSHAVSRRHARLLHQNDEFFLEDLGSTNGVFLNGKRVSGRVPVEDADEVRITEFLFRLALDDAADDVEQVVREKVSVSTSNQELYSLNPKVKLQMILELSRHLSRALDQRTLLKKLLDYLFQLFPLAEQGLIALWLENRLVVCDQHARSGETDFPYSRSLLKQALAEEAGILSEDVRGDERFASNASLMGSEAHSVICVPLFGHERAPLGVLHLACCQPDKAFQHDDLHLLSTIGLQVAVVLENAALNEQRLREAQMRKELAMARDIQQGCLPADFDAFQGEHLDLFGKVWPAHEVSGDLYDFLPLDERRPTQGPLAFFVGDVSGKGMPAALFMFAVRSLARHLALAGTAPAETLKQLKQALARDNPSALFVTLLHGVMNRDTFEVVVTSAGHCLPLLRQSDGTLRKLDMPAGRFLGSDGNLNLAEIRHVLAPGESLIAYTDGCTETFANGDKDMFGIDGLHTALQQEFTLPVETWAGRVKDRILRFGGGAEPQDDLTLVIIHRKDERGMGGS